MRKEYLIMIVNLIKTKKVVPVTESKDGKEHTFYNCWVKFGNTRIAIKEAFEKDRGVLKALADEEKGGEAE